MVLVNGVNYSWANVTWMWYGVPIVGIKSIKYGKRQEKHLNYGQGTEPISRGYGNSEYYGELEIYLDEWNKIIAAAPNNDPTKIPGSDMNNVFGGDRVNPKVDVLKSVELVNDPVETKQGDGSITVKIELSVAGLVHKVV